MIEAHCHAAFGEQKRGERTFLLQTRSRRSCDERKPKKEKGNEAWEICADVPVETSAISSTTLKRERERERDRERAIGGRVRSSCEATTVDPSRGLQMVGGAVEPGHPPPTPRAMAAVQVVRQPIRRVVSFGSLTVGGCLTPERPQIPVAESHGASGCTALSQPGVPPIRGRFGVYPQENPGQHPKNCRYRCACRRWSLGSPLGPGGTGVRTSGRAGADRDHGRSRFGG